MKSIRKNNSGMRFLMALWSKHCRITSWHEAWVGRHIEVLKVKRRHLLSWPGDRQKMVYFVSRGMLARVAEADEDTKRSIMSIALPGFALTTTAHLYSNTPHQGNIVALRASVIVGIPYKTIRAFKEQEPAVETLIDILMHKKKRQLETYVRILHTTSPFQRYLLFDDLMPEIQRATTQSEQAEFLGISRDTVQKAQKFLLNPKTRLK